MTALIRRGFARAPGGLPVLGHAVELRSRPLELFAGLSGLADVVELRLGTTPVYLVCDPRLVQRVLLDSRTFEKGGPLYRELAGLLGDSLATSTREKHRAQRRMAQPSFQHARMPGYAAAMLEEIDRMLSPWRPGTVVDFSDATRAMTLRVVARALFATHVSEDAMNAVQQYLPMFSEGVYRRMTQPVRLAKRLPTRANRRFDQAATSLRDTLAGIIAACRAARLTEPSMVADLLAQRDEAGNGLTERELIDHCVVLFLAGAETSATAIAWTFHALTQHPEVESSLHAELDSVLANNRPLEFTDLARLAYTGRLVTEVLRRYPPIWVLTRTTVTRAVLGEAELAAGASVIISPYALHQNPIIFPDPTRVDPDRWLPHRAQDIPKGAWLPFGAGSRKCIGDEFGTIETILAVAAVAARWRLHHPPSANSTREIAMTSLTTGPMPMALERRALGHC